MLLNVDGKITCRSGDLGHTEICKATYDESHDSNEATEQYISETVVEMKYRCKRPASTFMLNARLSTVDRAFLVARSH